MGLGPVLIAYELTKAEIQEEVGELIEKDRLGL